MIDVPDDFFEFMKHLTMRRDRWLEAGAWGSPNLKDCILFMLTEAREVQKLTEQSPGDNNLALATEAFDCLMMAVFALETFNLTSIITREKLSDIGAGFTVMGTPLACQSTERALGFMVGELISNGLDALDEVMRLDAQYHRNDSDRKTDLWVVGRHVSMFARTATGLIIWAGYSPVDVARRKLAVMDEKRGIAEE